MFCWEQGFVSKDMFDILRLNVECRKNWETEEEALTGHIYITA